MKIGFDFDNTLISYDKLFHGVAVDKRLVPSSILASKKSVRDYLRKHDQEEDWTCLQGEVYGNHILQAEPFSGVKSVLRYLSDRELPMCIVSHKTRRPYIGEPWDLHTAARDWLEKQGFHDTNNLMLSENSVFFELTKEAKVARICALKCTHYVDDLPEILGMLPDNIEKILFAPSDASNCNSDWKLMSSWQELPSLLEL